MKIRNVSNLDFYQKNTVSKPKSKNQSFGKLIPQVSKDSQSEQVKKSILRFMNFMKNLSNQAKVNPNSKVHLENLIGKESAVRC